MGPVNLIIVSIAWFRGSVYYMFIIYKCRSLQQNAKLVLKVRQKLEQKSFEDRETYHVLFNDKVPWWPKATIICDSQFLSSSYFSL